MNWVPKKRFEAALRGIEKLGKIRDDRRSRSRKKIEEIKKISTFTCIG